MLGCGRRSARYLGRNRTGVQAGGRIYNRGGDGSGIDSQENRSVRANPWSASGISDKGGAAVNDTRVSGKFADVRRDRRNGMVEVHEPTDENTRSGPKAENIHGRFGTPLPNDLRAKYWRR
jgi:hypothetical protein